MNSPPEKSRPGLARWAIGLWLTLLIVVAVVVGRPNKVGKLYPTFVDAGAHFAHSEPLYGNIDPGRDQFRYSPLVAAAFAPWSLLPMTLGGILWRWSQAALLLYALKRWCGVAVPSVAWPCLFLLALPLAGGNIHNGQLNPLVLALMLGGIVAFDRERLWLAAFALGGAAMFKIYPAALGLLFILIEPRRFPLRFLAAIAVGIGLPFLFRDFEYLKTQFAEWADRLSGDDRSNFPMAGGYHDFQKLLRIWGMPITLSAYRVVEVAAGGAMAILVVRGRLRGWARPTSVHFAASLGFVWVTLFGPATETATYCLLAAIAPHAIMTVARRSLGERALVGTAYLLFASVAVSFWIPPHISDPWRALAPQAHGALLLLIWVVLNGGRPAADW